MYIFHLAIPMAQSPPTNRKNVVSLLIAVANVFSVMLFPSPTRQPCSDLMDLCRRKCLADRLVMIEAGQLVMPLPEAYLICGDVCHIHPGFNTCPGHFRGDALCGDACCCSPSLKVLPPHFQDRGLFVLEEVWELPLELWDYWHPSLGCGALDLLLC